tara:strand:- start:4697 stop:5518 length:822 start_codon:yes stop_codon:yes gene_type:complete
MQKLLVTFLTVCFLPTNANAQGYFSTKKQLERKCINELTKVYKNHKDLLKRDLYTPEVIENVCSCFVSDSEVTSFNKNKKDVPQEIGERVMTSCHQNEVYTFLYGGDVFFNEKFFRAVSRGKNNLDYSIAVNSVKQEKIRGSYGRYLLFYGRTTNRYSGETIPAKPGFIDCDWGGSGSSYINKDYGSGSWSSDGYCYGEEGTPERVIPGGIDRGYYKYSLDCFDKTFDRKGDREDHSGTFKKGWMKIGNDPTAILASYLYCPVINTLPKNNIE